LLQKGKLRRAEGLFKRGVKNRKSPLVVAYYGLAKIYSDSLFPQHDIRTAYRYIIWAFTVYNRYPLLYRKQVYQNYGISYKTLVRLHDSIVNPQMRKALNSGNIMVMNKFIYDFSQSPQADTVQKYIDSVEFAQVRKENTVKAYQKFIHDHPNSYYLAKAKSILDTLWQSLYYKAMHSYEPSVIELFQRQYPNYPYKGSEVLDFAAWAEKGKKLLVFAPQVKTPADIQTKIYHKYVTECIKFIKHTAPSEPAYLVVLKLMQPPFVFHQWQQAIDTLEKYKPYFPKNKRIDELIALLKRPDKPLKTEPVPGQLNTKHGMELLPVLTADDKTMYFCGEDRSDNLGKEDVYVSHLKNGKWTKAHVVTELSTESGNEAPLSVSADGNTMIIFKNGDLYLTHKTKNGWSYPLPIPEINSDFWDADAFITADGTAILFVSDRPNPSGPYHPFDSYYHGQYIGNTDIWVIVRKGDHWSKPINLGKTINTPYSERTPFLHPDMHTLYFASDGHASFGSMDIFVSHRLSDTSWTQWSKPVNLGKWFNSPNKEYGYVVSTDGKLAYYTKFFNHQSDIYQIALPQKAKPKMVVVVTGFVRDSSGNPIQGKIIWEDLSTGKKLGQLSTDPQNGKYLIPLPEGKEYGFYVSAQGYYPISDNLDLTNSKAKTNQVIRKDFILTPISEIIREKIPIRLNNIFFDFNSTKLKKESYPELKRFAAFVKQHPDLKFEISGHTDSIGTAEYNMKLSYKRAKVVEQYLVKLGCNPKQFKVVAYGASRPVASNATAAGRKLNRRVEFRVLGKLSDKN
jgi:outer membrane protein OmpA-like peptidoglycan-associated protein/tetratricopeptide (TPR) repeat protein